MRYFAGFPLTWKVGELRGFGKSEKSLAMLLVVRDNDMYHEIHATVVHV